jgi:hypothetical protein
MTMSPFDDPRQVRNALRTVATEYGVDVLSMPQVMSNLLADLLPDEPRAARILIAAADEDVTGKLRELIANGMDVATAARLTATAFADATIFAPEACAWVVSAYAEAAGLGTNPDRPVTVVVSRAGSPMQNPTGSHVGGRWSQASQVTADRDAMGAELVAGQHMSTSTSDGGTQRLIAALAEVNALRLAAGAEAEQLKETARREAEQILATAQQEVHGIMERAQSILAANEKRKAEIDGLSLAAESASKRLIDQANRDARLIVARARQQIAVPAPTDNSSTTGDGGILRRLPRRSPEPEPPEPVTGILRIQPQRQSRSKRSGRR